MKKGMLFVLLLASSTVFAQGYYPDGYAGDPVPDGCYQVESWLTEYHDMNPWSMPDPTGRHFVYGEACVEQGVLVLHFTDFAWRFCTPSFWGSPDGDEVCYSVPIGEWRNGRHVLAWDEARYITGVWVDDKYFYAALMFDASTGEAVFIEGVFGLDGFFFVEDDDYTRATWKVREE